MTIIYTPTTTPRIFHHSNAYILCKKLYTKLWTEAMNFKLLEETKMSCRATYLSIESHQIVATAAGGTIHVPKPGWL